MPAESKKNLPRFHLNRLFPTKGGLDQTTFYWLKKLPGRIKLAVKKKK